MKRNTPSERKLCVCGKRIYSQNDAVKISRRMNHDQANEWPVGPYRCDDNRVAWHIGHQRARALNRKASRRVR